MDDYITFTVTGEMQGQRLDRLLSVSVVTASGEGISRARAAKLIEAGNAAVNGKTSLKSSFQPKEGDVIELAVPAPEELKVEAENIPLEIFYEDDSLLVVNKPKGMVVHPAAGNYSGTLVNALLYHCRGRLSSINGVIRPGIVHRIDKLTSGLLIAAKDDRAHRGLAEQIKSHSFTREYRAIVCRRFSEMSGTVDAPIGRHPVDRKKMAVTNVHSRSAVTHYTVLEEMKAHSLLSLRLETGRTHQIRVHMAHIGHPVLGDEVYGKPFPGLDGQCLHAAKIGFIHPVTYEYMEFESELPQYFMNALDRVRRER